MASTHLAVLGFPIEHSKSPVIHTAAYDALGLDWDYGRFRIESNELSDFLAKRDSTWRGLSLTMPLKEVGHELSVPSCPVASASIWLRRSRVLRISRAAISISVA